MDSIIDIDQVNENVAISIQDIGPFGETNPEPVLVLEKGQVKEIREMSYGKHLKFYIQKGNKVFECLWWNSGEYKDDIKLGSHYDIAFKMNMNVFRGTQRLQLTVEDMRVTN